MSLSLWGNFKEFAVEQSDFDLEDPVQPDRLEDPKFALDGFAPADCAVVPFQHGLSAAKISVDRVV